MEQIGFIGAYDKKDLLLNAARVLERMRLKVLIVDATFLQRMKYMVPNVSNQNAITYISDYQGIDVAIGFMNLNGIAQYLGTSQLPYDLIIVDSDNNQTINSFMIPNMKKIFFVTSYDEYEVQRSLRIFSMIPKQLEVTKVIMSSDISNAQEKYLQHTLEQTNIKFTEHDIIFMDTNEDRQVTLQNQRMKETRVKHYSSTYKAGLEYLTSLMADEIVNQNSVKNMIRKM